MPTYDDVDALRTVEARLATLPPLVKPAEIRSLTESLATVGRGEAALIQGGDCAETFSGFSTDSVEATCGLLDHVAGQIERSIGRPAVAIGRMAGQFGKPRSSATERRGDTELPTYRGDIVNGASFDADERMPDPGRMESAYLYSAATMNKLRMESGHAGAEGRRIYISHEALLLPYETALLRQDDEGRWYCGSGHFVWVGDRTRQIGGAHVEFLRGVHNPIGIKVGPSLGSDELLRLLDVVDPDNKPGRCTLIVRLGSELVDDLLPELLATVMRSQRNVVWICDPMHGNTFTTLHGRKTRSLRAVTDEAEAYLRVHERAGSWFGGFHLEMSGDSISECIGRSITSEDSSLAQAYLTTCDPRLNSDQASFFIRSLAGALGRVAQNTTRHRSAA